MSLGRATKTTGKLRVDPWTLVVKTDDYTFAATVGEPLTQSYWNGQRLLRIPRLPFFTARDGLGLNGFDWMDRNWASVEREGLPVGRSLPCGQAQVDLTGTSFCVEDVEATLQDLGFSSWGLVVYAAADGKSQRLNLCGGGYCGRFGLKRDRTLDERAQNRNADDEGRNGGWVLQLALGSPTATENRAALFKAGALYRTAALDDAALARTLEMG